MYSKIEKSLVSCGRSELIGLFSSEHRTELLNHISSLKEEHSEDKVIALLWCYLQAQNKIIPISFVAATISEKLSSPELIRTAPDLCVLVYIMVAKMLQEESEHRLCLLLLEPIYSSLSFLDAESKTEIKEILLNSIKIELLEAPKRKEEKSYLAYIENLKNNISNTNLLSKNETLDKANQNWTLSSDNSLHHETELSEPLSSLLDLETEFKTNPLQKERNKNTFFFTGAFIVLATSFFLLFWYSDLKIGTKIYNKITSLFSSQSNGTVYSLNMEPGDIGPYLPTLPAYSTFDKDNHLDSISERLSNIQANEKETPVAPSATPAKSIEIDNEEIESLNVIPESAENIPLKKIPTSAISAIPSPVDLGSSNKGAPLEEPSPKIKADGKLYGGVSTTDPVAGKAEERALDGSPLKSYEVEKYDPPELYSTITGTNVLSAPSLMSESIGRLETGTTVRVTAKMGQWTEIRSNAGRLGYIFLKDLKKEDETLD